MTVSKSNLEQLFDIAFNRNRELPEPYQEAIFAEGIASQSIASIRENSGQRRVLLVGGAGYIGSVVTEHLLSYGFQVRCIDLLLYHNQRCVMPYLFHPGYQFCYGDFGHTETAAQALSGCTDVVLLAGLVGDPITKQYPKESHLINDQAIRRFIAQLSGRQLNKMIFVSTCSNYGLIGSDEQATEDFSLSPLSLYSEAKVAVEQTILDNNDTDYCRTILRFATAFGLSPRTRFDLTVNEFTRELALGKELLVFDAETWRPYCHVRDFARLIRRVLEAPKALIDNEVFNAGGDINNCTKQIIVDKITTRLPEAKVRYQAQGPDPRNYRVSFEKVRQTLHFTPDYTVDEGIEEIISALRQRLFDDVENNKPFYGNYQLNYRNPMQSAA